MRISAIDTRTSLEVERGQFASPIAVSARLKPPSSMRARFQCHAIDAALHGQDVEGDFLALHLQENNATGWLTRATLTASVFTKVLPVPGPPGRDEILLATGRRSACHSRADPFRSPGLVGGKEVIYAAHHVGERRQAACAPMRWVTLTTNACASAMSVSRSPCSL